VESEGQVTHAARWVKGWKVLAAHRVQALDPLLGLYEPAAQGAHTDAPDSV
jgi:hypothetical protein